MKLNRQNYFSKEAEEKYMSFSQYRNFIKCEAMAMAKLKGDYFVEDKDFYLMGSYLHAWNERRLEAFKKENPSLFRKDGKLYAKYKILEEMINTLEKDKLCMMALEGEKEVIITGELFETDWKIIIDSYNPQKGRFSDLKVVKSLEDKFYNAKASVYENFIEYYGYLTQIAIYAAVEREATKREEFLEPFIVAVTKESPPNKAIIGFDNETINFQLIQVQNNLPRILKVKSGKSRAYRCESCHYCRGTKQLTKVIHYSKL